MILSKQDQRPCLLAVSRTRSCGDKELTIVEPCKRRKLRSATSGMDADDGWTSTVNAGIMTPSKVRNKHRMEPVEEKHAQEDTVTADVEEQGQDESGPV